MSYTMNTAPIMDQTAVNMSCPRNRSTTTQGGKGVPANTSQRIPPDILVPRTMKVNNTGAAISSKYQIH